MKHFEIENTLFFEEDEKVGTKLIINSDLAEAEIYLLGANLTHFKPKGQEPLIFDAKKSYIDPQKSAHFGIPVCWPWFGPHPTNKNKPQHGFARNLYWSIQETKKLLDGQVQIKVQQVYKMVLV